MQELIKECREYIQKNFNIAIPEVQPYQPKQIDMPKYIDHTQLAAEATPEQIKLLCDQAKEHHFMSCCVNPAYAQYVHEQLKDSDVKTCVVIGFPLGMNTTQIKVAETKQLIEEIDVDEIDMVINVGMLKAGKLDYVCQEIKQIAEAVHNKQNKILKVIIEAAALTDKEIVYASLLSLAANADFVKTSTGFHAKGGAKEENVKLMRECVGNNCGVKAAGGIRTYEDFKKMIAAGADRIGCSKGMQIIEGASKQ